MRNKMNAVALSPEGMLWTVVLILGCSLFGARPAIACQAQIPEDPEWPSYTMIDIEGDECPALPCGGTTPIASVPDECGNTLSIVCKPHNLIDWSCRFKYKYNGDTKGECVYYNGQNAWGYIKDGNECFIWAKTTSVDPDSSGPGDEGEPGQYDWVVNTYDVLNDEHFENCRHSYTKSDRGSDEDGDQSACE